MPVQTAYIAATEYEKYGLPATTVEDAISQASDVVDAFLQRPAGLLWAPDTDGTPLYMARKNASCSRALAAPIVPGANVPVALSGGPILAVGDTFVLNRALANTHISELCVISAVVDNKNVVLASVAGAHATDELFESDLLVEEIITLPRNLNVATVSEGPIVRVASAFGRWTRQRRGDAYSDYNDALSIASAFGGTQQWTSMVIPDSSVDKATNQVWLAGSVLGINYNELKITYVAGYSGTGLPYQIKKATANIVKAMEESPVAGGIKLFRAGETQMERFLNSIIDDDTRALLTPFMAKNYG